MASAYNFIQSYVRDRLLFDRAHETMTQVRDTKAPRAIVSPILRATNVALSHLESDVSRLAHNYGTDTDKGLRGVFAETWTGPGRDLPATNLFASAESMIQTARGDIVHALQHKLRWQTREWGITMCMDLAARLLDDMEKAIGLTDARNIFVIRAMKDRTGYVVDPGGAPNAILSYNPAFTAQYFKKNHAEAIAARLLHHNYIKDPEIITIGQAMEMPSLDSDPNIWLKGSADIKACKDERPYDPDARWHELIFRA